MDGQLRTAYKEGLSPNIAVSASGLQLYKPISADIDRGDMDDARQAFQSGKAHTTGDTPVSGSTLVEPDSGTTMLDEQHDNGVEVIDRESHHHHLPAYFKLIARQSQAPCYLSTRSIVYSRLCS